ncbi:Arginyl-tRNA--protein transferase 1 [Taenia solium]|eukprot:TsM_000370700 transcript=TsM_000370700 gene=TsM_000370700
MQYYLGYYIHFCTKMLYKAHFSPSYLACPQTHVWVSIERCRRLLDQCQNNRFVEKNPENTPTTH